MSSESAAGQPFEQSWPGPIRLSRPRSVAPYLGPAFLDVRFGLFLQRLITVIPALIVIAMGLDAYWILILSQVSLSVQLPFAIVPLVWLTARRDVMGRYANARRTTLLASLFAALIIGLNVLLLVRLAGGLGD
jgi:manganese transport protein